MGRRSETTEYLKTCMADAVIALMREKPLDKINITEITALAGVGRMTYFRCFSSKTEILQYKAEQLLEGWMAAHPFYPDIGREQMPLWFFSFFESQKDIALLLYRENLHKLLLDVILERIFPLLPVVQPERENRYMAAFVTYGLFGVLTEWMAGGCRESAAELVELCVPPSQLSWPG